MKAYFDCEGRFAKVTVCYQSQEQKKQMCAVLDELSDKYEMRPEVYLDTSHQGEDEVGEIDIEFADDYNEDARLFIEEFATKFELEFAHENTID